jgi:hypothetical protein
VTASATRIDPSLHAPGLVGVVTSTDHKRIGLNLAIC